MSELGQTGCRWGSQHTSIGESPKVPPKGGKVDVSVVHGHPVVVASSVGRDQVRVSQSADIVELSVFWRARFGRWKRPAHAFVSRGKLQSIVLAGEVGRQLAQQLVLHPGRTHSEFNGFGEVSLQDGALFEGVESRTDIAVQAQGGNPS